MEPTNKFRWNKTKSWLILAGPSDGLGNCLILQQWWAICRDGQETPEGEWRDIQIYETL
jgi:hypothetical protein